MHSRLGLIATRLIALAGIVAVSACGGSTPSLSGSGATTNAESSSATLTSTTSSAPLTSDADATSSPPTTVVPAPTGSVIIVGESQFGSMLFDSTGQAIYLFDVETSSTPSCYNECAVAWPPVLTDGAPQAGAGVDAVLLGTTTRTDGQTQVTYNGHPLYFYAHEGKFDVQCHDVFLNGGNWYVVQPDGNAAPPG